MTETEPRPFPVIREAVASFPDREHFRRAVSSLLAAGLDQTDLSVLASHQPLGVADDDRGARTAAGPPEELTCIGPQTIAGIARLSGRPIAATGAALVGAGL